MTRRPSCQVQAPTLGKGTVATRPTSIQPSTIVVDDSLSSLESLLDETVAYRPVPSRSVDTVVDDDGADSIAQSLVGETLGQYRLEALIGQGSMGQVYRAEHLGLHRPCAIKVMNPRLTLNEPQIRERFWAEARAAANLMHPHVVTIHNLGCERGYHFIEMEYVRGGVSLRELVVRDGPLEPIHASRLVRQVALALNAAHDAGLVHRDVKPANVLLNDQGLAKLADFGLVRRISELEQTGVPVAGTPMYMAPELFEGIPASHRSDLYAVGVMFYYLLSARLPFASDQIRRLVKRHRHDPVPDIRKIVPGIPDALLPILERCLAKRPDDRYESAAELERDLQSVITRMRDTETLVRECVEGLDCFVQGGRDNYRVLFRLPANRLQEVYLEVTQNTLGERLLSVFSVCGPADPRHFEFALRLNDSLTFGTLSIRNVQGRPMFVMNRTFLRDQVTRDDVRSAMLEIARRSDRVEHQLTDADVY
ncbi:MAG: serine/threonine-protein kinase [Isosphaeraceae bacterium]